MNDQDFSRLSAYIERELGIKMPPAKRVMLESRLSRRLRQHSFKDYTSYVDYVFSDEGSRTELIHMIDAVTTNKTDFFREADHFDYLLNDILPKARPSGGDIFRVWSGGCSTGEEPYTLSMVLEEYRRAVASFRWSILATDISTKVLGHAVEAIYEEEKVAPVPLDYKKRYLLKSKDSAKHVVRVKPELRSHIEFQRLNFMDDDFGIRDRFDVIFCRNVIIYFDRQTQERLIRKFYDRLIPGGALFLGHSETLTGISISLRSVAPTVYIKG
ncbi:MAG: protein-glutamate O-methyltransferase [Treponemataceae bacterium]